MGHTLFDYISRVNGAGYLLVLGFLAGFALLMSLLTLASIRLPQLAPVWALGTRRAPLGRLGEGRPRVLAVLLGRDGPARGDGRHLLRHLHGLRSRRQCRGRLEQTRSLPLSGRYGKN